MDQATAALIRDLKQRDMLKDTLVVWGGGIQGGISYGSTDELGYAAAENPVAVPDFHATMLHLLGIDHQRLTVKFHGLDARLTGIAGNVVEGILV